MLPFCSQHFTCEDDGALTSGTGLSSVTSEVVVRSVCSAFMIPIAFSNPLIKLRYGWTYLPCRMFIIATDKALSIFKLMDNKADMKQQR
ncbi:hypothetical protein J6590_054596 [Homalodisca vitripennis]|nr:hypothetical protein J6590_054596 [Homalodisca vitripennis]